MNRFIMITKSGLQFRNIISDSHVIKKYQTLQGVILWHLLRRPWLLLTPVKLSSQAKADRQFVKENMALLPKRKDIHHLLLLLINPFRMKTKSGLFLFKSDVGILYRS